MKWMKRVAAMLLTVALLSGSALAENRVIYSGMNDAEWEANELLPAQEREAELSLQSVHTVGNQAVIIMRNSETRMYSMYTWQEGQSEMTLVADDLYRVSGCDSVEELESYLAYSQEDMPEGCQLPPKEHVFSFLVGTDTALYGINVTTGDIFTISGKDGKAVYQDVAKMSDNSCFYVTESYDDESYTYSISPEDAVITGEYLLMRTESWNNEGAQYEITCVHLTDGSVSKANIDKPRKLLGYKDGLAVVLVNEHDADYDDDGNRYPWKALTYHPASGETKTLVNETKVVENYIARESFTYSQEKDCFYYASNALLYGTQDLKDTAVYAYLPIGNTSNITIVGDSVVCGQGFYGVIARTLVKDYTADHTVNVLGYLENAVTRRYGMDNPDIVLTKVEGDVSNAEDIASAFAKGTDAPDVAFGYLNPNWTNNPAGGWFLDTLNARGYCMDLSIYPRVKEYVESLNPVFRDLVTDADGKIFALPTDVYGGSSFTLNPSVFTEMGLTIEEIPTNLVELCEFITRWNDEFVEEYPNYAPIDSTENYRKRVFDLMVDRWVGYCQATNQELHFDDPIFREMMDALSKMEYAEIERSNQTTNAEESDYKQPLIWTSTRVTDAYYERDIYFGENKTPSLIQMTLTKDAKFVLSAGEVTVYYVNPRTTDKDQIETLLNYVLDNISPQDAVEMVAGATEPVEDPYYQEYAERWNRIIEEARKAYEAADESEKADYKMMLDDYTATFEMEKENSRYIVTPEYIQRYQDIILPALYVRKPSILDTRDDIAGLETLMARFLDGQINLEQFIREADNKLRMVQLENQ